MKVKALLDIPALMSLLGAGLSVLCGLVLWSSLGEGWINASYDYLFRFGAREVTNQVVLVLMDAAAASEWNPPDAIWYREKHTQLLKKLAQDACPLVVFDVVFESEGRQETDAALAEAMKEHGHVVLAVDLDEPMAVGVHQAHVRPLAPAFRNVAQGWGIGMSEKVQPGGITRRHWPFPAPGDLSPSLPWKAAGIAGATLPGPEKPVEQWLRYYGASGPWTPLSYHLAVSSSPGFFRGKTVFVGKKPYGAPALEEDKPRATPYTRWGGEDSSGVEILATTYLNLLNGDWLRRPAGWVEFLVLVLSGVLLGGGLCRVPRLAACLLAGGTAVAVSLAAVSLSFFSNYWFPWLVIVGGQVPCSLAWAFVAPRKLDESPPARERPQTVNAAGDLPDTPDYELFDPPLGAGAYGKVWLVRNAIGQWQALKAVYRAKFGPNAEPYDREFNGIKRFKPVAEKHPGLLRVDFVSRKKREGYFYYVMELADAQTPGWQDNPAAYKPRDLANQRAQAAGQRLPVRECISIGLALAEALDFLHQQGFTHRDIKPQNIIFVNGRPKLADVGLVAEIRPSETQITWIGTAGYMPPPPEVPGTVRADIYALGMVLYVTSTGRDPVFFPELSASLIEPPANADFLHLNAIILKACHPDRTLRFQSAAEMRSALRDSQKALDEEREPERPEPGASGASTSCS